MDFFDVLTMFLGLALFLLGMNLMGNALEKRAGSRIKKILSGLSDKPLKGFLLGAAVTAVIQSSSATTVMVVGFVNSGLMTLRQAIYIIMGANVGTTVTAWILSLSGIQGDSFLLTMLKPTSFTPILAVIGIIFYLFLKNRKRKDTGMILLGFAVLMTGMDIMSGAVSGLKDVPEFANALLLFSNPLFGVLAGTVLTAIIQSSSASVGILQALSSTGTITFGSAIPIIMGQNIGTCVTALLSSIGANKNAKRAAMVHLYFNIIGTVVLLSLFYIANAIFTFPFITQNIDAAGIATVHTSFNLLCTLMLLPFGRGLEKLACLTVREKGANQQAILLDDRLLGTPSVAVERCERITMDMAALSCNAIRNALPLLRSYQSQTAEEVRAMESEADRYEDALGSYLVKLSSTQLNDQDSMSVTELLHLIGDFERISDHAVNLVESAEEITEKKVVFSPEAMEELNTLESAVMEILSLSEQAFCKNDLEAASMVEPLEQVIDDLRDEIKRRHIIRLQKSACTIEHGFVLSDILTNLERVADHCSNVAACLIEAQQHHALDMHDFLSRIKAGGEDFNQRYRQFKVKYALHAPA